MVNVVGDWNRVRHSDVLRGAELWHEEGHSSLFQHIIPQLRKGVHNVQYSADTVTVRATVSLELHAIFAHDTARRCLHAPKLQHLEISAAAAEERNDRAAITILRGSPRSSSKVGWIKSFWATFRSSSSLGYPFSRRGSIVGWR